MILWEFGIKNVALKPLGQIDTTGILTHLVIGKGCNRVSLEQLKYENTWEFQI